ncbi:MAG: hypothetical protein A2078_03565 [Nitrospirae bacterium GWC2_57_9]|nr:MAG: hypothetical protein A2078_03565 [Nitrospirae bacterium GWC2_57_9]
MKVCDKDLPINFLDERPGDVIRHFADTSKAKEELGFVAKIEIETGVKKYLDWFKNKFPDPAQALKFYEEKNW